MNTKISYLYRDADNYKKVNECVIAGALTAEQICAIKDCCDMGEYFIPSQVGLPERRFDRYDPAVDHCWFELDEDSFSGNDRATYGSPYRRRTGQPLRRMPKQLAG